MGTPLERGVQRQAPLFFNMRLRIYKNNKKSLQEIALTITKMVSRKGYTVSQNGNENFTVQSLERTEQQDFIKTLVSKWCDKNGVRYECFTK